MPNHCSNNIFMTGPEEVLKEIERSHFDENGCLSFHTLIPMPVCMQIDHKSTTRNLAAVLEKFKLTPAEFINSATSIKGIFLSALLKNEQELIDAVKHYKSVSDLTEDLVEAQRLNINYAMHRHTDWYSWSVAEWGTKWTAYDGQCLLTDAGLDFHFDTAWSPPAPVMAELADLYPEVEFIHRYIDEGGGFAGTSEYDEGILVSDNETDNFDEFAKEHFGWSFDEDGDEDE